MLIPKEKVYELLAEHGIQITGVLHVGAHECEEIHVYNYMNIPLRNVIWIDALQDKVISAGKRGIPNVYQSVISDKDDETVSFMRTNNDQSSSILEFGTHAKHHAWCVEVGRIQMKTITIDTFMKRASIKNPSFYNFWNFDIQGAELLALKGAEESIKGVKALYLEVNSEEVYKSCPLIGEIDDYLKIRGFKRVHTVMTNEGWGDALYVSTTTC